MSSPRTLALVLSAPWALAAFGPTAIAQTAAPAPLPDAGQLLREQNRVPATPLVAPRPAQSTAARLSEVSQDPRSLVVARLLVVGASAVPVAEIEAAFSTGSGAANPSKASPVRLTLGQMQAGARAVTALYASKGFFLARAAILQNAWANEELRLTVTEGRLDAVSAHPAWGDVPTRTLNAQGLAVGKPVREAPVERTVMLMAERGSPDLRSVFSAASESGGTVLGFQGQAPGFKAQFAAGLDNEGTRQVGSARVLIDADAAHWLTLGDALFVRGSANSANGGGSQSLGLGYSGPLPGSLGFDGWRASVSASTVRYQIGGDFAALGPKGHATSANLGLRYPIILSASRVLSVEGGLGHRQAVDDVIAGNLNDKRAKTVSLGFSGLWLADAAEHRGSLSVSQIDNDLSRNAGAAAADAASASSQGKATRVRLSYGYAQPIRGIGGGPSAQMWLRMSAQAASKNLDTADKFALGGANAVRAWPSGEAAGDEGWMLNLDVRDRIGSIAGVPAMLGVFADYGQVTRHKSQWAAVAAVANTAGLSGVGMGLSLERQGSFSISFTLALPVGGNEFADARGYNSDGKPRGARLWLSARAVY